MTVTLASHGVRWIQEAPTLYYLTTRGGFGASSSHHKRQGERHHLINSVPSKANVSYLVSHSQEFERDTICLSFLNSFTAWQLAPLLSDGLAFRAALEQHAHRITPFGFLSTIGSIQSLLCPFDASHRQRRPKAVRFLLGTHFVGLAWVSCMILAGHQANLLRCVPLQWLAFGSISTFFPLSQ